MRVPALFVLQGRIKWKVNFIPGHQIAGRLTIAVNLRSFQVTIVTHGMHRLIRAHTHEGISARIREPGSFLEDRIEYDLLAAVTLAPDSKMPRKLLLE